MDKNKLYAIATAVVVGSGVAVLLMNENSRNKERLRRQEKVMECLTALKELTDPTVDIKKRVEASRFWIQVIKG